MSRIAYSCPQAPRMIRKSLRRFSDRSRANQFRAQHAEASLQNCGGGSRRLKRRMAAAGPAWFSRRCEASSARWRYAPAHHEGLDCTIWPVRLRAIALSLLILRSAPKERVSKDAGQAAASHQNNEPTGRATRARPTTDVLRRRPGGAGGQDIRALAFVIGP